MRHLNLALALLSVALLWPASSHGQDKAIIIGRVLDQFGNGLAGVTVLLHNDGLNTTREAKTTGDGSYLFEAVTPASGFRICIPNDASKDRKSPSQWCTPSPKFKNNPLQNPLRTEVQGAKRAVPSFIQLPATANNYASPDVADQEVQIPGGGSLNVTTLLVHSTLRFGDAGPQDSSPPASGSSGQSAPQQGSTNPTLTPPSHGGKTKVPAELADSVIYSSVPLEYYSTAESTVISGGSLQFEGPANNDFGKSSSSQPDIFQSPNELRSLPFFNRNFLVLGLLAPSTHDVPAGSELQDATFSISGQRPTTNLFLLDGMDNTASGNHQAIPFQVNDAIQEFRVVEATADAQFGNNLGGIVNVVTQRGGSQFHGSLFGYFASDSLDASSPLSVYNGTGFDQAAAFAGPVNAGPAVPGQGKVSATKSISIYEPLNYNQYVATVGQNLSGKSFCTAPNATPGSSDCLQRFDPNAVLAANDSHTQPLSSQQFGGRAGGSFGKGPLASRWFWFGDYEGTRIDNPNPIFERVPSSYDRSQWQNIPRLDQSDAKLAQSVLALYPQSNVQAIPDVLEFYRGYAPNYTNVSNYMGRMDFDQSDKSSWNARYNLQQLSQLHDDTLPSSQVYPGNGAVRDALNQNAVLTLTHQFSPNVTNVLRGGFTRFQVTETPQDASFDASQNGLPGGQMHTYLLSGLDSQYAGATPSAPKSPGQGGFAGWLGSVWIPLRNSVRNFKFSPVVTPSLDGLFPFARIGAPLSAPGERQDSEIEVVDNLAISQGKHLFRTGLQISWNKNVFNNGGLSRGFVVSGNIGEFTTDSETGSLSSLTSSGVAQTNFADPSFDYAVQQPSPYNTKFHSYDIGGYFQDTWRLSPNLTFNLGLRYEFFSIPKEYNHQIWNYDAQSNGLVQEGSSTVTDVFGQPCGAATYPNNIYPTASVVSSPWNCQPKGNGSFLVSSKTNFEPRVGIAWSTPSGATVLRAGFGIYYDQIAASNIAALAFNRPTPLDTSNPELIYDQFANYVLPKQVGLGNSSLVAISPANTNFQAASMPSAINALNPSELSNPMTRQVSASIQQQVIRSLSIEVAYIGNYIYNLPSTTDTNFNNEWFCTSSKPNCDVFSYVPIFTSANIGYGNYNAAVVRARGNISDQLQLQASYTFSKALDTGSGIYQPIIPTPLLAQTRILQNQGPANPIQFALGQSPQGAQIYQALGLRTNPFGPGSLSANLAAFTGLLTQGLTTTGNGRVYVSPYNVAQDPYNYLANDYGRSDYDQTNRFVLEYTWTVPMLKQSIWLNGWMLSGVFTAQSGQPFTIFVGPVGGELDQRVNLTGPVTTTGNPTAYIGNIGSISMPSISCGNQPAGHSPYVDVSGRGLFAGTVGSPCTGDSARNQFTGPAYVDYDMAVQKTFKVRESMSLIFRVESYNLFNRANYYNPISTYSLDGASVYSQFGEIKSAHNPRQFQFAARVTW